MERAKSIKRWRHSGLIRVAAPSLLALVLTIAGVTRSLCAQSPPPASSAKSIAKSTPTTATTSAEDLRVNHLQAKGTHNSYHLASPAAPFHLDYSHAPLRVQLEAQGVRQFELDVHWSADDGQFRVWHEPSDEGSTCDTFIACLTELRGWSEAHPWHHVLMIAVELKTASGGADAIEGLLRRLDEELRTAWPDDRRLGPDELLGDAASLVDAVAMRGWPTLAETRGEALFVLWNTGRTRAIYSRSGASLAGRAMFIRGVYGSPTGVVLGIDKPQGREAEIRDALSRGFLVRVRADRAVVEPLLHWTLRRDLALSLGATWVATDFPAPESGAARRLDYYVEIPGGQPSRCNPVTAPRGCQNEWIEPIPLVAPIAPIPPVPPVAPIPPIAPIAPVAPIAPIPPVPPETAPLTQEQG
jgi:Phosphoinositide phospholipase C, Ca2+-dependent